MKLAKTALLTLAVLCQIGCGTTNLHLAPQNPIVGKWRSADGGYTVEFLPTGDCSARMRIQGREIGGPCKYTVENDTINIRYYGPGAQVPDGNLDASVKWRYSLAGDDLKVTVQGTSLALRRVH